MAEKEEHTEQVFETEGFVLLEISRGLILDDKGGVLIALRGSQDRFGGLWHLPGGKFDEGDFDGKDVLIRELEEEMGFKLNGGEIRMYRTIKEVNSQEKKNVLSYYYEITGYDSNFTLNLDEISETRYIYVSDEIHNLEFAFDHDSVLLEYFQSREQ